MQMYVSKYMYRMTMPSLNIYSQNYVYVLIHGRLVVNHIQRAPHSANRALYYAKRALTSAQNMHTYLHLCIQKSIYLYT